MKKYKPLLLFFTLSILITPALFAQWQADQRLTNTPTNTFLASNNAWNIAASGDSVHIVFMEHENSSSFIHYTHSYDGGVNWSTPVMLNQNQDTCSLLYYSLAVSGSNVHVIWADKWNRKLMYRRSTDAGMNWTPSAAVVNPGTYNVDNPCLAIAGNYVYLVWNHNPSGGYSNEIYFQRSIDGGANWNTAQRLTNNSASILDKTPSIAASANYVHITWQRGPDYDARVLYLRSSNNGTTWETEQYITNDTINQTKPCITASGNYVHIAWEDTRTETLVVFCRSSFDNGASWLPEKNLCSGFSADYQTITAIGRNVHLAWRDYRFNQEWHIGYRHSIDNGNTWFADTILNTIAQQEGPSIAVAGTRVHLIWNDNRDGNWEIYYKRNPTGSGINEASSIEQTARGFEIYPNPASSYFTIHLPQSNDRTEIKIFDVTGIQIKEFESFRVQELRVPINGIRHGIYFVQVNNEMIKEKLIVPK